MFILLVLSSEGIVERPCPRSATPAYRRLFQLFNFELFDFLSLRPLRSLH